MRSAGKIAKWKFNHQPKSPVFTFFNSPKVFVITGLEINSVDDRIVQSVTYTQIPAVKIRGRVYDLRKDDDPTLVNNKAGNPFARRIVWGESTISDRLEFSRFDDSWSLSVTNGESEHGRI